MGNGFFKWAFHEYGIPTIVLLFCYSVGIAYSVFALLGVVCTSMIPIILYAISSFSLLVLFIAWKQTKYLESKKNNDSFFLAIDDGYKSFNGNPTDVLKAIHLTYGSYYAHAENNTDSSIMRFLNRSLYLKNKIKMPESNNAAGVLSITMLCGILLAIPALWGNTQAIVLFFITIVVSIFILINVFLTTLSNINLKTELMNYELKQVEKMILEYQENSISKIKAYKEKKANESK